MELDDEQLLRLVTELCDVQVANLEVQRELYEVVLAQNERVERATENNAELRERGRLLQDRNMDLLVAQRRLLSYWLPGLAIAMVCIWALLAGWLR